ncbi:MAG: glycosyltransferase family 2 protein [bacterium]
MNSCLVVLHYNKVLETIACLTSIRKVGYDPSLIYVYDNGSLVENRDKITALFPEFHHYYEEKNYGYSGGFNRALSLVFSKGFDGAFFLTNDTEVISDSLELIKNKAVELNCDLVAPLITYKKSPDKIDSIGGFFDKKSCKLYHYKEYALSPLLNPKMDYVPGTALWIARDLFIALNGMDEGYFTYWEDADFCFRAYQLGARIGRCYEARILHKVGKTCHSKPLYTAYYFQRNRIWFCRKYLIGGERQKAVDLIHKDLKNYERIWNEKEDKQRLAYLEKVREELATLCDEI